jgi:hypothetical protein
LTVETTGLACIVSDFILCILGRKYILGGFHDLGVIDKKTFYQMTPSATNPPRIYFLPKIHKMKSLNDTIHARPVVSTVNSPLCGLSKFITDILTKSFKSKYSVKNSFEFVEKLKSTKVPNGYTMISLDVQSLFTSIPKHIFIECVKKNWDSIKQHTSIPKDLFINALVFIINNSYFTFNNQFFLLIDGLPMGLDLSCIASAYVMEHIIDTIMLEIDHHIELISLYVDDTFIIINEDETETALHLFNSFNPRMKFTIEFEDNKQINFLDTTIRRHEDGSLSTKWYSKQNSAISLLNYNSSHTMAQKINVVHNLIKRVTTLTTNITQEDCFSTIYNILLNNGYPKHFIKKQYNDFLHQKSHHKIILDGGNESKSTKKFLPLINIPGITSEVQKSFKQT